MSFHFFFSQYTSSANIFFFFFNDTATTEIYTLSLHDALPILDACLVCVPTPLDEHREPDLSYIRNTAEEISAHLRPGQLIVLESTTYPGTTEEVMLPILERSGLRCPIAVYHTNGRAVESRESLQSDFLLAFSREREDPGNKEFQTHRIPKL